MANITPEKFQELLSKAPQGTSEDILRSTLQARGHTIEQKQRTFGERFRASFGTEDTIAQAKAAEEAEGRRGFSFADLPGDIADVAGGLVSTGFSVAGGFAGGLPGLMAGTALGEFAKRGLGKIRGIS